MKSKQTSVQPPFQTGNAETAPRTWSLLYEDGTNVMPVRSISDIGSMGFVVSRTCHSFLRTTDAVTDVTHAIPVFTCAWTVNLLHPPESTRKLCMSTENAPDFGHVRLFFSGKVARWVDTGVTAVLSTRCRIFVLLVVGLIGIWGGGVTSGLSHGCGARFGSGNVAQTRGTRRRVTFRGVRSERFGGNHEKRTGTCHGSGKREAAGFERKTMRNRMERNQTSATKRGSDTQYTQTNLHER